jgi:hypothetical protein
MPGFKGKRKGGLTLTLYKKKHFDIQCLYIACITAKETSKNLFGVEDTDLLKQENEKIDSL